MYACVLAHSLTSDVNAVGKMFELLCLEKSKSIFQKQTLNGKFKPGQRWTTENSKHFDKRSKMNGSVSHTVCKPLLRLVRTVIGTRQLFIISRDSVSQPLSRNQLHGLIYQIYSPYSPIFVLFLCSRTKRRAGAKRWDTLVMTLEVSYKEITIFFFVACSAVKLYVGLWVFHWNIVQG